MKYFAKGINLEPYFKQFKINEKRQQEFILKYPANCNQLANTLKVVTRQGLEIPYKKWKKDKK